jgi:hypothetical protein
MRFLPLLLIVFAGSAQAVPVVPSFTQGSMTSRTETTTKINEVINSIDFNTGYQYSVSGQNIAPASGSISPRADTATTTIEAGKTATWTQLDMSNKPQWNLVDPGGAFQFVETYSAPGLANQTIIERQTDIQSVTDTTSIFQR